MKEFDKSKNEPTLYVKQQGMANILIIALYVDDLILTRNSMEMIEDFRKEMMNQYGTNDLGFLHHFLEMEIY